ncbi:tyrosine-type recombinase/integrase [Actinocrispum sp. NPDC049592]|uniref:tyrosine-type recombinase/integrase n=1 Tax=Actinocrispum sp. NPDC049592 TaxID=3154835 RepID=UPI0034338E15
MFPSTTPARMQLGRRHPQRHFTASPWQLRVRPRRPPPIRLHDLRHGAATLELAAGVDMKMVQEMLRHSSITVTSDMYTNLLPEVARAAADTRWTRTRPLWTVHM